MTSNVPAVSVVMPVHNGARYLAAAINSVLSQTFTDFELVISDDASRDDSLGVIASFNDPRIRLIRNERNLGFGGNWNRCLSEARGEFIKLLPQDDLLDPQCISAQVHTLRDDRAAKLALVFSARRIIDPAGDTVFRRGLGNQPSTLARDDVLRRTVRSGTNPIGEPGAVLFRKSAAEKAGLFDGTCPFVIDLDYWLRLLEHGDAYYLPEYLSAFRISRQSHSVSLGARQAREFATFIESLSSNRGGPLGRFDVALGKASSRVQAIGRMAFQRYAMLLSRDINR